MLNATMRHFTFEDSELAAVRHELYGPAERGFHLIRGFAPSALAEHMQRFWTVDNVELFGNFEVFGNRPAYEVGSGPFATHYPGRKDVYYFPLWARPQDEVTLSAAVAVIQLRNQIEQRPIFRDLLPCSPRMAFYMVLRSLRSDPTQPDVRWHTDEFPHDERYPYVETRLQRRGHAAPETWNLVRDEFAGGQVDVALVFDVFPVIAEPEVLVRRLAAVLVPGGTVVTNFKSIPPASRAKWAYLVGREPAVIEAAFAAAGFRENARHVVGEDLLYSFRREAP
jgi:hypothetical protein